MEVKGHPMLRKPQPITMTPKPHNARKYCEFHEQNGHTTAECREMKKALHELVDKRQIGRFLKRGPRFHHKEHDPVRTEPREEELSMEVALLSVNMQKVSPSCHGRPRYEGCSKS